MSEERQPVSKQKIDELFTRLNQDAEDSGYHLNPDIEFTRELVESLIINQNRYGYMACPCRLAAGDNEKDLDIICPCDYRDPDLSEYGACYCALYVSQAVLDGTKKAESIPERRPDPELRSKKARSVKKESMVSISFPVWRCRVCGYLCARDAPPEICPVCKARKDRFEIFLSGQD